MRKAERKRSAFLLCADSVKEKSGQTEPIIFTENAEAAEAEEGVNPSTPRFCKKIVFMHIFFTFRS